ncbi:uncharacterized protein IUM83_19016 [Phytophthora cinnamomi]|uniref:uncharacterized protein n=1 Tax=Phytophthora cinnamomi TaxID=4785 RepID=UPI00355A544E|nr:hypothetical protein IUM83_19016 [Phytophthora cinnamomi]
MDIDADAAAAAAAGQLSQADIIERQAETIARLQRQVRKGGEYKQLTKSKLKEAAARLKEYRLRVEALQQELQEERERAQQQLKRASAKARKQVKDAANQTPENKTRTLTRASQTQLSGAVQKVNKRTLVDSGVQTVDHGASRKRSREKVSSTSTQTEVDQLVPRLSRDVGTQVLVDAASGGQQAAVWTAPEPLKMDLPLLGASAFPHETSAALDAELAFSDSDDGTGDTMELDDGQEDAVVDVEMKSSAGGSGVIAGLDQTVLDEIDKELASSSDEDEGEGGKKKQEDRAGSADTTAAGSDRGTGVSLLDGLDPAVSNEIDKDLESSSDEGDAQENSEDRGVEERRAGGAVATSKVNADTAGGRKADVKNSPADAASQSGGGPSLLSGLDPAISSAIDDDLATSSDDEDNNDPDTHDNSKETKPTGLAHGPLKNATNYSHPKRTLMSIDDELDDEFAALDSDSESERKEKTTADGNKEYSSSSSDSSDSDSSGSSDSDSDGDADDLMTGSADKNEVSLTHGGTSAEENKKLPETSSVAVTPVTVCGDLRDAAVQPTGNDDERGALPSLIVDKDAVVLTTPVKKKPVTAAEDVYSPIVEVDLQPKSPEPLRLNVRAETILHVTDKEGPSVAVASYQRSVQEHVPDTIQPMGKQAASNKVTTVAETSVTIDAHQTTSASSLPSSKQQILVSSTTSLDKSTDPADFSENAKTTSVSRSLDSVVTSTVEPVEPDVQEEPHDSETLADAQSSEIVPPTKDGVVGKARKAEEASLDDTQVIAQKKIKLSEVSGRGGDEMDEQNPQSSATAQSKKADKKPAASSESKEEVRMKKSLTAFKKAIVLSKGEEADKDYARRTIALLVNQSSKFVDTSLAHVTMLSQVLADLFRELGLSPMTALRGVLGVVRAPRSRRLMQDSKVGLSWLCNELLLKVVRIGGEASVGLGLICQSSVDEWLQHLRSIMIEERTNIGDSMSSSKIQVRVATRQISVSHDKVFLAHICALYTHLCQSTGQLARSRVLLFDLLRDNPNIIGLYFAAVMVEIYPAMLERKFDQHCVERQDVLKETVLQALVVIACVAAERQELLLHQSSHTMLHRIADAIQMPELEEVNGADPSFSRAWVQRLYDKLVATCQPFNSQAQVEIATAAGYYEFAKSLEICTAVFGLDVVTQIFSINQCQELFSGAALEAKGGVVDVVSHIALAVAPKTSDMQNPRTRGELYVESVIDWLNHILVVEPNGDKTSADDLFKLLAKCAAVCVELVLEYSAAAGLDARRRVLCAVVRWFEAASSDQLVGLPASFLRRLRLAVVAARPQMVRAGG